MRELMSLPDRYPSRRADPGTDTGDRYPIANQGDNTPPVPWHNQEIRARSSLLYMNASGCTALVLLLGMCLLGAGCIAEPAGDGTPVPPISPSITSLPATPAAVPTTPPAS